MNAYAKIILLLSVTLFESSVSFAADQSENDRYQLGVKAYQKEDFLNCAIQMESLKDSMKKLTPEMQNNALYYRAICNGKIGYSAYSLPFIKQIDSSYLSESQIKTLHSFERDMQQEVYKIGYDLYLKKDYLGCASQLELLKEPNSDVSESIKNKILLYRSACNAQLGYKPYSAGLIDEVNEDQLTATEKDLANNLKKSLAAEIEAKNKILTYITLYGGAVKYSPEISKTKASLYGISTFFTPAKSGWDVSAALEKVKLTLIPSTSSYDQTQVNVAVGKNFLTEYSVHLFYTNISTSNADSVSGGNKGNVVGASGSVVTSPTSKLTAEFSSSSYPVLSIGKTTVKEYVLYWDKTLMTASTYSIGSRLLVESVHPTAPRMTDSTGFTLKSHYERYALDLTLYFSSIYVGVTGWTGGEALGSRNQGSVVYNSLEERKHGYSAFVNFIFSTAASLKVSYSSEKIENATSSINGNTSVAALTFNF